MTQQRTKRDLTNCIPCPIPAVQIRRPWRRSTCATRRREQGV